MKYPGFFDNYIPDNFSKDSEYFDDYISRNIPNISGKRFPIYSEYFEKIVDGYDLLKISKIFRKINIQLVSMAGRTKAVLSSKHNPNQFSEK